MLGGYACFWAFKLLGLDPFLSLPITIAFLLIIGLVVYKLLFVRMVKLTEEVKIKNTMLIGFGLSLILQNLALQFGRPMTVGLPQLIQAWSSPSATFAFRSFALPAW